MKLYIWKHKDTAMQPYNFYPLAKAIEVGDNGFYAISVHAFFKKKDAIEHLKEIGWDKETRELYELISVEIKN